MKSGSYLREQKQRPEVLQLSWKHPLLHGWMLWKGQYTGQSALGEEKETINRLRNETSKGLAADQLIDTTTSLWTRMAQMYEQFVAIRQNFTGPFYHPTCHVTCALATLYVFCCPLHVRFRATEEGPVGLLSCQFWTVYHVVDTLKTSLPPPCHSLTW